MASPQSKRAKPEISVLTKDDVHTDKYPSLSRPLTPLTPLREDIVADHWAESDDKWQRCAETGYRLPGESEKALVGPLYPDTARPEVRLGSLSKAKKKLLREIFSDIVEEWPTSNSLEHADSLALSLVNQDVFLMECVQIPLGKRANRAGNANSSTTAYDLVKVIEAPATKDVSCQQIYSLFRGYVIERIKRCEAASGKNDFVPSHFKKCWDASNDYREIFSGARRSGRKCRQDAVWIGLERLADDEVEAFNNRHFVETREQVEKGLESGAFDEDGYILINGLMHRICAPPAEDQRMRSIILWTKDGPDDENPTWNKVFGGVIYNVHKLDKTFGDENQLVTDEMTGVELAVHLTTTPRANQALPRGQRIATGGTMVKAPGHQAAFGQPYQATIYSQIKPMEVTSKNPKPATIEKVQKIEQLRMRMKHGTAGLGRDGDWGSTWGTGLGRDVDWGSTWGTGLGCDTDWGMTWGVGGRVGLGYTLGYDGWGLDLGYRFGLRYGLGYDLGCRAGIRRMWTWATGLGCDMPALDYKLGRDVACIDTCTLLFEEEL
ncbi:hypothetical protein FPV67DRAFT_1461569 [Lyophyllum atratum]|nr:hypothetical protein FPV67DRAFT_1461569 [Lyophyllum atratum]